MSILKKDIEEFEDSKSDYGRGFFDGLKLAEAKLKELQDDVLNLIEKAKTKDAWGYDIIHADFYGFMNEFKSLFKGEDNHAQEQTGDKPVAGQVGLRQTSDAPANTNSEVEA